MALKFVALLALAAVVRSQLTTIGSCPDLKAIDNFDLDKFLGKWYEYERYYSVFELGTICSQIEYTKNTEGKIIAANSITTRYTGINRVVNGELKLADPTSKLGKLAIRYEQLPVAINSVYNVLATDYKTYAILWSCSTPVPYLVNMQNAWLMTRDREPTKDVLDIAHAYFTKLGIRPGFIQHVDQSCANAAAVPVDEVENETAEAEATAPVAEESSSSGSRAPIPAVRNQQVPVKPDVNVVDVEDKKPIPVAEKDAVEMVEPVKVVEPVMKVEPIMKVDEAAVTPVVESVTATVMPDAVVPAEIVPEVVVDKVEDLEKSETEVKKE